MRYFGNLAPLPACERTADLLCKTFGGAPGQRDIISAGNHVSMAPTSVLEPVVLLYRFTGEKRYLDFCNYFNYWEIPRLCRGDSQSLTIPGMWVERKNCAGVRRIYAKVRLSDAALKKQNQNIASG